MTITRDTFEQRYAERSGYTVAEMREQGIYPVPCSPNCDYEKCEGWCAVSVESVVDFDDLGMPLINADTLDYLVANFPEVRERYTIDVSSENV